jgi:hypothetical protein
MRSLDQNVMSEGTVRQWRRMFRGGRRTDVHEEERIGRPSVLSDELVKVSNKQSVKGGASQFQNFHVNSHKLHEVFSARLSQLG